MKRKRVPAVIIAIIMIISSVFVAINVFADDVSWRYDSDSKTLYISGSGAMEDYENVYTTPWYTHLSEVESVVIEEGVTSVGANSFSGAGKLTAVSIANTVKSVNSYAFASCALLKDISFSENVVTIADYSFAYNGVDLKDGFTVHAPVGSFALHYIIRNNRSSENKIDFATDKVECGKYAVHITQSGGMMAYYPYTPKYSGTFKFYSTGTHDTRGYIYNSSYKQIAYNDDSVGTNFGISSISLEKGETYYFGARIMNSSLKGTFDIYIEPVEYTVSGTIYAMNDPSGAASDIVINEALLDGVATDGTYTRTVTASNTDAVITVGTTEFNYTFSPDKDEDIVLNMCDVNDDGYVNGRDLAYMKTSNSKYIGLFKNFI